ncbi:MAG: EAL and HDOD domain-containing protein [Candidatus Tectimicrobiota bacterium]
MSQPASALAFSSASPGHAPALYSAFVGRQPIYTRTCEVFAYELLFRSGDVQQARVQDGNEATAHVLVNTFLELGLDTLVGSKRAFINVTRDFLLQDFSAVFPADQVVLEVLEDVPVDDDVIRAVRSLSQHGYSIALDDFIYQEHLRPLVELADIIKIDVLALERDALREHVQRLRHYNVQLLAEKVETQDDVTYCRELGFDYFQGYFFCRPDVVKGQRSPTNRLVILELLAKLQNPATSFQELETIISRDVSLSYKILRLANTAYYARARKVQSIHEALRLVGLVVISNMISLCLLANIDDKPHELLLTAMVRAKMCEQIARTMHWPNSTTFFTIGLLSVLDAFMDRPMQELLSALPLVEEIRKAILAYEGRLGATLRCVLDYEQGDWTAVARLGCPVSTVVHAYLSALHWATEIQSTV